MGSQRLKALELGEAERAALGALAVRRRTAQGLARRARIVLACAEGLDNKDPSPPASMSTPSPSANGGSASPSTASKG